VVWFQDEARIGQKNKITRRRAKRGTRPLSHRDQRTSSAYIFGAICPKEGKGAGLVMPFCNSTTMALHLAEISQAVAQGAHAVLLMDQAGWHSSAKLDVPDNITIVLFPSRSPELNPVENVWQFMRLKTLRGLTPHEYVCKIWTEDPRASGSTQSITPRDCTGAKQTRLCRYLMGGIMGGAPTIQSFSLRRSHLCGRAVSFLE
jgi:hypothetical protein